MDFKSNEIQMIEFEPGNFLFAENEKSFHFFIIQDGKAEIFKNGLDGKKIILAEVEAGNSIGEFAMIDRQPRSASAQALTKVKAARISDQAYQALLEDLPDWALAVMKSLVERLRQTNELLRRTNAVDKDALNRIEYDTAVHSKAKLTGP